MAICKNDLVTASVDQRSYYEVFHPANINSASASPPQGGAQQVGLVPNRRRLNVVSTPPRGSPGRSRCNSEKGISLLSICQYRSEIDLTSVRHLFDIVSTFAGVGRYPDCDPLLQQYPTHSLASESTSLLRRFQGLL